MPARWPLWLSAPLLVVAFLAGGELAARLDDLVRYGVPLLAAPVAWMSTTRLSRCRR
jgi:hypothetical protein